MFEAFRRLISDVGEGAKPAHRFDENDYRLAATALLVHAARVDGQFAEAERVKLRSLIKTRFDLDETAAAELIAEATEIEREAIDLFHFTSQLNRDLDEQGRARMVEMMWQIAYADGVISEFEDNLIWRAADLLGISQRERIALRNRVAESRQQGE
ncbi:MAG TPA: TerB family tellurite resistance protein [Pseudolabrys sp.]|jgi:uncharacterized tellurite resistance protein B-like protein|nr:TerB family tellurite resistance protein [Pseudolabrys sp.]